MALPELELYLYRLKMSPAWQGEFLSHRVDHLASQPLADDERAALVAGNVEALWQMGVHPMLMAPLGRLFGLSPTQYRARLRPLAGQRDMRS